LRRSFPDRLAKQSIYTAAIAAVLLAGCKRHSLPANYYEAPHSLHVIPAGTYDAIFTCYASLGDAIHKNGGDSIDRAYLVQTSFYKDGSRVKGIPAGVKVTVNGETLTHGINERVHVELPTPVTWRVEGDDHYPSINHTIASGQPIDFVGPSSNDTISMSKGFDVRYNAPGIDSVQFHLTYFADVVKRHDTSSTITRGGQSSYNVVANTGHYTIPPMAVRYDQYRSFTPKRLIVQISWGHGDTVHNEDKVYGFIAECNRTRWFDLNRN